MNSLALSTPQGTYTANSRNVFVSSSSSNVYLSHPTNASAMLSYVIPNPSAHSDNDLLIKNETKLKRISLLEYNWNGNGAYPLPQAIIDYIAQMLPSLIRQPEIFPTASDSIQLEYEKENGDYLEFEIFESSARLFQSMSDGYEKEEEIIPTKEKINEAVRMFYGV